WPSIPWFEYKPAYEATKPLLDAHGCPQRLGIFETRSDGFNFLYDILVGVRSHNPRRSKMRFFARILPTIRWRRRMLNLLHHTAVTPVDRRR
ncbi:MAG: beta-carotene hydroxylase, partial [Prochlorococcus sp.]